MLERLAEASVGLYSFLLPLSWMAFALLVVVAGPLAIFRSTRFIAGSLVFGTSFLFGATTWFLGAAVTFGTLGWFWLLVGLMFAGMGVVPLGIIAAFFILKMPSLGLSLLFMGWLVFGCRAVGALLMGSAGAPRPAAAD